MKFFSAIGLLVFLCCLGGCASTPDAPPQAPPAATPKNSAAITYRVTGAARGITGIFTDASGNEVAIPATVAATGDDPAYAPLPWEITLQIPYDVMRTHKMAVGARDAFGTGATINVEIVADGKVVNSGSGTAPRIDVLKD